MIAEPTEPSRRTAQIILIAGLLVVSVAILWLDRPISTWSHDVLRRPAVCIWLTWLADIPVPASVIGLAGAGLAWLFGWRPGRIAQVCLAMGFATLTADALKDVLKFGFGRLWPESWLHSNPSWIDTLSYGFHPFHGGAGYASFPSGHTTVISAPCAVLWPHAGRHRPLCATLPLLVALGLIGSDYHFLSDCIAGALLGTACGATASRILRLPA